MTTAQLAKRDPKVHARDAAVSARIAENDWPMFLPSSAVGDRRMKRLIANGLYAIWRVEGTTGITWLRMLET